MISPDAVAATLFGLAILLPVAWLGGVVAERLRQPPVIGELIAGILVALVWTPDRRAEQPVAMLAEIGVVLLLFEVGLETSVTDLAKVGVRATLVAVVGVVVPTALGFAVGAWLLPDLGGLAWTYLGATLCATSVGITARVLRDLGKEKSVASRVVLGAAVVDDVLGLIVLSALVSKGDLWVVTLKAIGFLAVTLLALPPLLARIPRAPSPVPGFALCFALAWVAHEAGLAPIVGGFAAGVAVASARRAGAASGVAEPWDETSLAPVPLRVGVRGVALLLVPLFFIEMGRHVDLRQGWTPLLLVALVAAAIVGKLVSGLFAPAGVRLAVGIGMIPRGEVGLIFAGIGRSLGIVDAALASTLILVVLATTLIAPPLLRWRLSGD